MEPAQNNTPLIVDLGSSSEFVADLNERIAGLKQIWLTGYYLEGNTQLMLEVDITTPGIHLRNTVVAQAGPHVAAAKSVVLCEPLNSTIRRDLNAWDPLLPKHKEISRVGRLRFVVRNLSTGGAPVYTRLILFFVCETADANAGLQSIGKRLGSRNQGDDMW